MVMDDDTTLENSSTLKFDGQLRNTLFQGLTGRRDADVGGREASVTGMLQAAFGKGRRGAAVDTRAAARALGVSQRTIERWVKGDNQPRSDHRKTLSRRARSAATTKRGRRAAIQEPLIRAQAGRGARLTLKGIQGPYRAGSDTARDRTIGLNLTPAQLQDLLNIYADAGDKAAMKWLEQLTDQDYLAGWGFDKIDRLGLDGL